jgi:hypothetical protein
MPLVAPVMIITCSSILRNCTDMCSPVCLACEPDNRVHARDFKSLLQTKKAPQGAGRKETQENDA